MKRILSSLVKLTSRVVGKNNLEKLLIFSAKSIDTDLRKHALLQLGAGTTVYLENGSELFFIQKILARQLADNPNPLIFDVGANIGNYTLTLKENIKNAKIFSFEPVGETFENLKRKVGDTGNLYNIGFSNLPGEGLLYNIANTNDGETATMHKEILLDVFKSTGDIQPMAIKLDTIDNFCAVNNIKTIDFLKIDVEGNELSVMQGAPGMLAKNAIKIIQFEINAHNIYSRVFLRDFYLLLCDFEIFRLKPLGLLPLGPYKPINEIFTAQNMVAIHKTLVPQIDSRYLLTI